MEVTVNGTRLPLDAPVHITLLDHLRAHGFTGAKEGCAEGECGACAVLVARPDGAGTRWTAVNACLAPAAASADAEVVTAEGLGTPTALHPVQRELADRGGSQCGYCTPGFVCSMAAEYYRPGRTPGTPDGSDPTVAHQDSDPAATDHEVGPNGFDLHALSGNLCRCTGYRPIRDAAYALPSPATHDPLAQRRDRPTGDPGPVRIEDSTGTFVRPVDLSSALRLLADRPDAVVVAGSTDHGVEITLRGARPPLVVAIDRLPELRTISHTEDGLELGAAATLSEIERETRGVVPLLDQLWPQFASRLIRNAATLGGNLGTGSPIGDAAPVLLALDADLVLVGADGSRTVPLAQYFTGYRTSVRRPGELIAAVRIPLPASPLARFTKIAKRRFDDISSVAVAFALDITDGVFSSARIGLGGVAATPLRATATETALLGRPATADTVRAAAEILGREGTPLDDHRASAAYRSAMLAGVLHRLAASPEVPA